MKIEVMKFGIYNSTHKLENLHQHYENIYIFHINTFDVNTVGCFN